MLGEQIGAMVGVVMQMSGLGQLLSEKNLLMWRPKEFMTLRLSDIPGPMKKLTLFPSVTVMPIDTHFLEQITKGVVTLLDDHEDKEQSINQIASLLEGMKESQISKTENDVSEPSSGTEEAQDDKEEKDTSLSKESLTEREHLFDALSGAYSEDLAGLVLFDSLSRGFNMATMAGAVYRVVSADKKGNVLYLRAQTTFKDVYVDEDDNPSRVYLDEEFFFLCAGNKGLLVQTSVPSKDLRSDAYAWTQAWLTSLRVPME